MFKTIQTYIDAKLLRFITWYLKRNVQFSQEVFYQIPYVAIIKDLKNYMIAALLACWFLVIVLCYSGDPLTLSFIFFITLCPLYGIHSTLKAMKKCYEYKFEHRDFFL
ncbi:hypothetical protein CQA54_05455 [Helicobacter equorum]|uniref:Uncharacterized protein n=1 Tax=Helicobacter equorum TaxID=361872 RepID=A0A3D8IR74_9HELI|nr:hypothetical protein CQA54_05455 [Helicobacter equorum]